MDITNNKLLALFSTFLLLSSSTTASEAASTHPTNNNGNPVLDSSGYRLRFGVPYYMAPAIWAWGGGVSLTRKDDQQQLCPTDVVLTQEVDRGTPIIFTSADKSNHHDQQVITDQSQVSIKFSMREYCTQSLTWKIDASSGRLKIGGVEGKDKNSLFRIRRSTSGGYLSRSYTLELASSSSSTTDPAGAGAIVVDFDKNRATGLAARPKHQQTNLSFMFFRANKRT